MKNLKSKILLLVAGATLSGTSLFAKEKFSPLTITASVQHISCYGMNDGRIEIEIKGGKAPYIIAWDNGNETTIMDGLRDGEYSVKICDARGKETVEYFCIDTPDKLKIKEFNGMLDNSIATTVQVVGGSPWMIDDVLKYKMTFKSIEPTEKLKPSENKDSKNFKIRIEDYNGCYVENTLNEKEFRRILSSNSQFIEEDKVSLMDRKEEPITLAGFEPNYGANNDQE